LALAGAGVALAGGLVLHFGAGWKKPAAGGGGADSAPAVAPTNAVMAGGGGLLRTAGRPETEASRLLRLTQDWQRKNPVCHLHIESSGSGVSCIAEVYRFKNEKGDLVRRILSQISAPVSAQLVMQVEKARVVVFFPRSNQALEFDAEQDVRKVLGVAGLTTGDEGTGLPTVKPRSCFVETGQDFKALTMMFSGEDFGLPESAGAVFVTVKLDGAGQPLEVEELTLGHRTTSKLTYLSFDQAVVSREAPVIPAKARRAARSLEEVLREELKPIRNKPNNTI
jgi:hypothetical protein